MVDIVPQHLEAEFDQLRKELKSIALSVGPAYYVSLDQLDRDYAWVLNYLQLGIG